ncbi:fumarylacetoacetate hydrolase family protein [Oceanibacterium hippocampi]|uniref:Fumarylpyruvate hydrolase n=1 Tax=Oceanibacterium hippocampi TaxID=745714 RepID=A0A1Y5TZU9_9PROT|nr:fumarylacetoacetate hydrolase family protein [Oceanibacterium hippocampi]SLN77723.1 Fumarylpyruvate hydrolase [Oceanibacterium hippocampi]
MAYVIEPAEQAAAAVAGSEDRFPVRRIYCVGRNYAAHAREMGKDPDREPPFFFMKPADALVANGAAVPYPPETANLHHEIELVAAIGRGGCNIAEADALDHVWGYGVGIDLTRRDLQLAARDKGRPWDTGKGFDHSAPLSALHPASVIGHPSRGRIWLSVNGEIRQDADIADLIWSVPETIACLSALFTLVPGDLIYTGTPAGVGAMVRGDRIEGGVDGIDGISITLI